MELQASLDRFSSCLAVDYPQEGETISGRGYAVRISGAAQSVEIAIDGDEWRPCRRAAGCWWFDLSGCAPGRHQLLVRARVDSRDGYVFRTCRFRSADDRL